MSELPDHLGGHLNKVHTEPLWVHQGDILLQY